jgi:hypothetical protein
MTRRVAVLVCGLVLFGAGRASAQLSSWDDRGFLNLSGGSQTGTSKDLTGDLTFSVYGETASVGAKRHVDGGGGLFDVTAGARVWNNVGAAVSFWKRTDNADATVTASIPDLAFFDKPRSVSTTVPGLGHKETWVAVLAVYTVPVTDKIDVMILAGPAVTSVDHEIPCNNTAGSYLCSVTMTEGSSGPQLTFTRSTLSKSIWGYQLGIDGRYMFTKMIGAGLFLRASKATANLNNSVSLDLGGFQAGAGVRVRF